MKKLFSLRDLVWFLFFSSIVILSSCKKHTPPPANNGGNNNGGTSVKRLSDEDSLKFYVWWINASDSANVPLYLWEKNIPSTFNWNNTAFSTADSVLSGAQGITSFSEGNAYPYISQTGPALDRYSFLDRTGAVANELQGGQGGDFGFQITAVRESSASNNIGLYVIYVYPGSPAGNAGIQTGWKVASMDGTSTSGLTTSSDLSTVSKEFFSDPTTTFTFQKMDGSTTGTVSLTRTNYHIDPVLFDSVYAVNGENVGYFVYNSFISVTSTDNGAEATQEINAAFSKFKTAGVKDLIVDLRYNGGGSVDATEYLDNLMAPASANGQVMYSTKYNEDLTNYFNSSSQLQKEYLSPINFSIAADNLNLSRVFFIVSNNTASAAELTINNLKPYMNVYLIGDTTYGKPVGFFDIPIDFVRQNSDTVSHVADMYAINFQSVNKNGDGTYFSGMAPSYYYPYFDLSNWGDTKNDARLAAALSFISTGSYTGRSYLRLAHPAEMRVVPDTKLRSRQFNGMVDFSRPLSIPLLKSLKR